jgi:RimJ/RimL family protein N-acetyltransferase
MHNPVAAGERVYLRPIEERDAGALALSYVHESDIRFADAGRVPVSVMAFQHWIRQTGEDASGQEITFSVCRIGDDVCIGTVTLRHIDRVNRTAETGSGILAAEDRGRGLGTEAKHLLLRFAFETLGLHAISSSVYSGNARSIAALRKQGYRFAGRLTADVHRGGQFADTLMFDLLRHEWEAAMDTTPAGDDPDPSAS